jgi:PAS domain S-box-containing protein
MTTKADENELLRSVALQNATSILIARRRAEQRSEAYLAEAQSLSHTGSFGWRPSADEITWSEETFRIFQYDQSTKPTVELVLQRVHPDDAAFVKQTIERAAHDGKDFDHEYRLVMPDNSVKYVRVAAHAISDESGNVEFVGAVMDVTEQQQAKAALEKAFHEIKKSEGRLRMVIDTIPSMVWSGLPDGKFDFVSQPWLRYLGCSWEELSVRGGLVSASVHPDDVEESVDRWNATRATGRHTDHELRMRGADGQYRWFLARALPLRDEQGNIVRWYGTATDIEDRKRAEMLLGGEKRLLEMIARGDSLALILDALCRFVEEQASGSLSSILLLDSNENRLRHGAAPSLPIAYSEAIDGNVIGPSVGSCGTAAYLAEPVIVSDIATDPLWADYRNLALSHGLRACWSTPILSSVGRVLGTFAIYYHEPRSPTPQEYNVIEQITHVASIAIERKQAEEVLREQARLLDLTHDTIFVRDMTDVITYWNRGAEELYGWTKEEAVNKISHQLTQTIFPAQLAEINAELLLTGRWEGELTHTKRDGTQVVVASRWSLQRDELGRPGAILETNNDITDRKQAEEAQLRLGAIVASSDDAIISKTLEGVITSWNAGAERIFGYAAEEAVGRPITILIPPDRQDEETQIIERLRRGESVRHFETVRIRKDGRQIHVSLAISPIKDAAGRTIGVSKIARDITERKRAEAELRESEEQWRDVFENNPTMYFMVDASGIVLSVNPFGAEQLGYNVDELVGHPVLGVFPEADREAVQRNVASCLEQLGRTKSWEARKVRKDGTVLWVRETAKAVSRAKGPIVLIACEDVTEQKHAAEALRQAQADLAHVSRVTTMGELTASLAHEVNQPIAAAVTNANTCIRWLAGETPNIEEAREAAMRIVQDGTRAAEIISRIRLLFRKGTPERELVDVNEVIRGMLVLLRSETTRYSISVRAELASDLPKVMGDRVQLQQVMMNLMINSIDAMKDVEGTRELAIMSQRMDSDHLLVSVSDTGVGLPQQHADQIFNAFFTTKLHGTGMGLSISNSIVESHGGRLRAADNPPRGASFSFTLLTKVEATE